MHTKLSSSQATEEELRAHRYLDIDPYTAPSVGEGNGVDLNEMRAQIEAAESREACVCSVCEYVWPR